MAESKLMEGMTVHDLMPLYYSRLFPSQHMYKWLAYGNDSKHAQANSSFFQRREFCFTLDGDIFVRYQSFKDGSELHAALKSRVPAKIDIGPVYNVDPAKRSAYSGSGTDRVFAPVERELVFDIDMTDYDDVRTCCSAGAICNLCWPLMTVAILVIDRGLREDFGFKHIMWVFSGRRGIHCWVCDPVARSMTDQQRSALASYFNVYKGQSSGEKARALLNIGSSARMHPSLEMAFGTLETAWREEYLPKQKLLEGEETWEAILGYIPDEDIKDRLRNKWGKRARKSAGSGGDINAERWDELTEEVDRQVASLKGKKEKTMLARCKVEIIFAYTYPRLDVEVSKKMNHLLKAPFCVHPKTGKVCVPINPETAWEFDPMAVPTVSQLLEELNQSDAEVPKGEEWKSTSLASYIEQFSSSFLKDLDEINKEELATKSREAAAKPTLAW